MLDSEVWHIVFAVMRCVEVLAAAVVLCILVAAFRGRP
jgi:hypothetical protein